ncbi:hypothetical protein SDC9_88772 [bioreactor metagenome]|uniref:Uncharacterized protein n=1 Tax=bioreactor metagenome TaxID=1076179 RepID=A0A644ZMF6_9ZZZZ
MFFVCPVYLLHHHNSIVNNQPDGCGNGAQCHDVERAAGSIQHNQSKAQDNRNGDEDGEACFERTQKQDGDRYRQHQSYPKAVADAPYGILYKIGLYVERLNVHIGRQYFF